MICIECGENRPGEFYPYNRVRCKRCCNRRSIEIYHQRRKNKQAEYYRDWYRENGRERTIDQVTTVILRRIAHPEAIKANEALRRAIQKGDIIKPRFCSRCGRQTRMHGHHFDYSKTLEVTWLCASCHKKIHLGEEMNVRGY